MPCVLNAANEVAVASFLDEKMSFVDMPRMISEVMDRCHYSEGLSLELLEDVDATARSYARERLATR